MERRNPRRKKRASDLPPNLFFPVPRAWIMSGYQRIYPGEGNSDQDLNGGSGSVKGFRYNALKRVGYFLANLFLIGLPSIILRWYPHWKLRMTCYPCPLKYADLVLVYDENQERTICEVEIRSVDFLPDEFNSRSAAAHQLEHQDSRTPLCDAENVGSVYRFFIFQDEKYIWNDEKDAFNRIEGLVDLSCKDLLEKFRGMFENRRLQLKSIYGANEIDVKVKSYPKLLLDEVINPFYMFQVFSVILWCCDEYYLYAICVVVISFLSIGISLFKTRQQAVMLRDMARGGESITSVLQPNGEETEIDFKDLVPGDVVLIPPEGCIMPCDAVLIQGSCIVNESMLTGESVPVNKSAVQMSDDAFSCESHKKHVIFCGTQVIQPRFYAGNKVACVVVRTGYSTLKGELIRSILYPKAVDFKFYEDSMKFVFMLFCIAICGMAYGVYLYSERGSSWYIMLLRVLDILTIVVPPALPAAMTVGTLNAQSRLKKSKIFCISPQRINFCGQLKLVCFDKTGTLTEEGLNLSCVVPTNDGADGMDEFEDPVADPQQLLMTSPLLRGMATCHSLTHIKGNIVGDPLDMKMFEATGWILEEPPTGDDNARFDLLAPTVVKKNETELAIIRELDFTPQLQRMSVVISCPELGEMMAYCKGAPEKIRPLCKSVPDNYDKVLDSFTLKGYRVLGLGWKKVTGVSWHQLQRMPRENIESDLSFAGFLVMQNSLKPATVPVIKELNGADIRCVMVTGDNMLTALSVARECGMIPAQDKVVIVNSTDDGLLEYTLAAQHYEGSEDEVNGVICLPSGGNNNAALDVTFAPDSEGNIIQNTPAPRGLTKRFSLESSTSDAVIDMERLIPIGSELLKDSNYHIALTGKTWTYLQQNCSKQEFQKIVAKGTVFARMSPECKMQLVESLQQMDYIVAMCGDGANDCCALSTAHVGVSLSEAEASVAAPFTSKIADISCIPTVIREGRCALVTSFGIFKYMALYSIVQFASVLILYTNYTNLADAQFLWIDLAITSTVTIAMGRTEPVRRLVSKRPMGSLISFSNVFSIVSQMMVCIAIQLCAMEFLKRQIWFTPVAPTNADDLETLCWETTTIFTISSFQYLIMSVVFSKGKPFRKPFYMNGWLLFAIVLLTGFTSVLMIYPVHMVSSFFTLEPISLATQRFRYTLVVFPFLNAIISFLLENIVAASKAVRWIGKKCWVKSQPCLYKDVLRDLQNDSEWPPLKDS